MKNAYRELIRAAFNNGFTCSVWDGGEWQVKRSRSLSACVAAGRPEYAQPYMSRW